MRRILTTLVTGATVIALATPAALSAAEDRNDSTASSKSSLTTAVAISADAAAGKSSIRSSIDRAVSTVFESSTSAGQQPGPVTRKGTTKVRAQGGGGKTGMIIGLVSTVVGLAVTVYMVKAMQDSTKDLTKDLQRQR
jgi:hypothetical protein